VKIEGFPSTGAAENYYSLEALSLKFYLLESLPEEC